MKMYNESEEKYKASGDAEVQQGARMYLQKEHITPKMRQLSRQYRTPKEYASAMIDAISESDIQEYFAAGDWQPVAEKMLANIWKQQNKMKVVRK
jgi:acid phosphatase class B